MLNVECWFFTNLWQSSRRDVLEIMSAPGGPKSLAWAPLTPPGVAAFAGASLGRLLFMQLIFALLAASAVVWFLKTAWFPSIDAAIHQLPAQGEIRDGKLSWPANSPELLAEGRFLAFSVDLEHEGQLRPPAHLQVEFGRNDIYFYSLLGYERLNYPHDRVVGFNRSELEPKWGAWRPPILWLTFGGVIAGLMTSWAALATLYLLPVWLAGFFANRDLDFRASWKLAGAALMPGALLLTAAIFLYGSRALDLVQLAAAFAAHFAIGWIYLFAAPLFAPKLEAVAVTKENPFVAPPQESESAGAKKAEAGAPPPNS
jgi:hypothetical protein